MIKVDSSNSKAQEIPRERDTFHTHTNSLGMNTLFEKRSVLASYAHPKYLIIILTLWEQTKGRSISRTPSGNKHAD